MHHRWMARYLERRGWCVFYLEPGHRRCNLGSMGCWLELYISTRRRRPLVVEKVD